MGWVFWFPWREFSVAFLIQKWSSSPLHTHLPWQSPSARSSGLLRFRLRVFLLLRSKSHLALSQGPLFPSPLSLPSLSRMRGAALEPHVDIAYQAHCGALVGVLRFVHAAPPPPLPPSTSHWGGCCLHSSPSRLRTRLQVSSEIGGIFTLKLPVWVLLSSGHYHRNPETLTFRPMPG